MRGADTFNIHLPVLLLLLLLEENFVETFKNKVVQNGVIATIFCRKILIGATEGREKLNSSKNLTFSPGY